ncbi:hypothetical protein NEPTK9_001301 [Candidatus Neptunochlamydia vexilliferae]|uniref:Uncharacterized protein n=1 Tax=Candidatus Neptunichlamydia vexilliferae TaxID=1651774 RepID=A0ABS0B067_9BACT|nr:hypothetical protein [Candidatus Neptunochlamydia vexilliferae]
MKLNWGSGGCNLRRIYIWILGVFSWFKAGFLPRTNHHNHFYLLGKRESCSLTL